MLKKDIDDIKHYIKRKFEAAGGCELVEKSGEVILTLNSTNKEHLQVAITTNKSSYPHQ
ncbi:hypothetical protein KO527_05095 [Pseudoalteromonas sp. C2R02]|uniref:hypothetical protein n=1 Tax=Pseudoalteromonas sp. C2R02 TaxID=2841565 RepID=UPI001C08ACD7|nr:hypothetical protein [Pseudoalteromonas sp. C2R02]MBU2968723.1 hypothetical protein [Pseudoalteromonas sp. C2R02]